jgi:transcriptional regulator with XRE-family HTH domain
MDASRFAARLKELREAAGLTQMQLADAAGLSQRAVSHWEQGLREPAWSNVVAMAEALGVDCRAFLKEPASTPAPKRGRPAKAKTADHDSERKAKGKRK